MKAWNAGYDMVNNKAYKWRSFVEGGNAVNPTSKHDDLFQNQIEG